MKRTPLIRTLVPGFTLIELLVAVGLFTVVMVISIGALAGIINADRKAQGVQSVVDSLQFSLDDMSRSLITGVSFNCIDGSGSTDDTYTGGSVVSPNDCFSHGSSYIAVLGSHPIISGDHFVYWFSTPNCYPSPSGGTPIAEYIGGCILKSVNSGSSWKPITPPEVSIDKLRFYVQGSDAAHTDGLQPRAIALLSAHVNLPDGKQTRLNLQTSFTQRVFDQ